MDNTPPHSNEHKNGTELQCSASTTMQQRTTVLQESLKGSTKRDIAAALAMLIAVFGEPPNWEQAEKIYFDLLRDIPPDVLEHAVRAHMRTSKWFPKPAELLLFAQVDIDDRTRGLRIANAEHARASRLPEPGRVSAPTEEEIAAIYAKHGVPRPSLHTGRERPVEPKPPRIKPWSELQQAPKASADPATAAKIAKWAAELPGRRA